MDDRYILENVDLFNSGNGINCKPLQSALQPLIVGGGRLMDGFLLSAKTE